MLYFTFNRYRTQLYILVTYEVLEGRFGGVTEFAMLMKLELCYIFFLKPL